MIISAAERLASINEYYFSSKLEQIARMNKLGRDVINLGIGSPDLLPSAGTIDAAIESLKNPSHHGYASYRGTPDLRAAMANWYEKTYSVKLDLNQNILPLLGSKEGIFYISMAFLNPGDKVLVPNPGYLAYTSVSQLAGAHVVPYDLLEEKDWYPDLDQLSKSDLTNVKIMWVNYPHMPTGQKANETLLKDLVAFGLQHKILICHDNPYSLVLNETPPLSILKFDPHLECSLELNSYSKAFNMAGWRVGMMMAGRDVVEAVLKVKSNVDSGMFLPIQRGAIEALRNSESWHSERNQTYRDRREYAFKIFEKLGYTFSRSQVGLFVWAKAPAKVKDVTSHVEEILENHAVFLTPGFIFGTNGERYARCSLCAPVEKFQLAFERLGGAS